MEDFLNQQKTGDNTYHSGYSWKADPDANSFDQIRPITEASTADANLWVYMGNDQLYGYVGLAYVGVLCYSKTYSCSINEKMENVVATTEVIIINMNYIFQHG